MTNEEIKNLKAGDGIKLHDGVCVYQFTVKSVVARSKGSTEKAKPHYFAVVEAAPGHGMRRDTAVIESDEYLRAMGQEPLSYVGRFLGAEKVLLMDAPPVTFTMTFVAP